MTQTLHSLFAQSPRQGLHEITGDVAAWLADQPVREGLLTIFIRHTSASILIQENVDPDRSEEHTSELQSLMRISYDVFCLKKKRKTKRHNCSEYYAY